MPDTTPSPTVTPPTLSATVMSGLFAKIDATFSRTSLSDLYRVSGADETSASFALFNMLRKIVLGDTSTLATTGEGAAAAQQAALDKLSAALDTGAFSGRLVSLVGQTGQQVAVLAGSSIGVRYSLANFVPFAITGATEAYARHNQDGSLTRFDPATGAQLISNEWLGDRSQLFAARLASGSASVISITGNQSWVIEDRTQRNSDGTTVRTQLNADGANRPTGRVTFGQDDTAGEIVAGGTGNDRLYGGGGDDNIRGGAGDDYIEGGSGNDWIQGGIGNDTLLGGTGDDEIEGGMGNDIIRGGAGDDVITGGKGDDRLDGGDGFDTYVIDANDGNDVIMDSDGLGQILYEGAALTGVTAAKNGVYASDDGKLTYSFAGDIEEGGVLTITTEKGRIKIRDFHNGMLGIKLGDGSAGALFPPAPPEVLNGNDLPPRDRRDTLYPTWPPVNDPYGGGSGGAADGGGGDGGDGGEVAAPVYDYEGSAAKNTEKGVTKRAADLELSDFITAPAFTLPLVSGASFASATEAWQTSNASRLDAKTTITPEPTIIIGITAADVTSAVMDFHNDATDTHLGSDALAQHIARDDSSMLSTNLGVTNKLGKQTASLDSAQIAPRIGS